ncbi:MAG: hypothetical protein JOZ57_08800, partial [Abitibacteriaceae bacterium]|nr:hypothetical protein [Abditibacteriaceae bacterium]
MSKESLRSIAPHSTAAATSPADGVSPDSMAHDIVPLDAVAQAGLTPPPATPVNITPPPRHAANVQLSDRWSWLWPSVPALLFLALAATIHSTPPPPPAIETAPIADARAVQETVETGVLPSSQTMIVKAKTGSGYGLLKAELQPTSQVTGQAPLSGQIARVLVRPGQFVDVNDRVLELSTGPTSRRASPVEKVQNSAEAAQVAAVHQQEDLNKKMERAKARLYEAQLRVAAARRRLAQARQMVLTLQNGGEVHLPADASHKPKSSEGNTATRPSARQHKATHEATHNAVDDPKLAAQRLALRDAQHDADKAQRAAAQATSKANAARVAAEAGDQKVRLKQSQLDQATAASDKVQDSFESGEAKGSDVATARAAVSNAKAALSEAAAKAADAHQEAEKQQTLAEKLQDEAKHFSSRVALASQKMKLLAKAEPTREAPTATEAPAAANDAPDDNKSGHDSSSGGKSDAAAVAQFVRDAQAESEAAVQNANHIKSEIDDYDNKVHSTTARLDSTSKELEVAQQTVVENNIKQNLSSVRAPASGVVLSVAEIARDVEPGEAIVT